MRRYDAAYRRLKAVIDGGAIGAPLMFHSAHRNAAVPAGALHRRKWPLADTMVHDIDVARFLLDGRDRADPGDRTPRRNRRSAVELRDPILGVLEMAGGRGGRLSRSRSTSSYGYDIRGEVSGEKGTAELAEFNRVVLKAGDGFSGRVPADWRERFIAAYDTELQDFINAAKTGTVTGPSAWDGYAIQVVSDAGIRAADTGEVIACDMIAKPGLYG